MGILNAVMAYFNTTFCYYSTRSGIFFHFRKQFQYNLLLLFNEPEAQISHKILQFQYNLLLLFNTKDIDIDNIYAKFQYNLLLLFNRNNEQKKMNQFFISIQPFVIIQHSRLLLVFSVVVISIQPFVIIQLPFSSYLCRFCRFQYNLLLLFNRHPPLLL